MREIGGYFNLEMNDGGGFLHDDGTLLNSCRNALEVVLLSLKPKRIWIPKYTCDCILQPISHLNLEYKRYSIDEKLEIININLSKGDVILYTNYFGIKDSYIKSLVKQYGKRLIVDNAQSYYSERIPGITTIYSPRKFFGVPDGGIAYIDNPLELNFEQDKSFDRCRHLLRRFDEPASCGYSDFRRNDESLDNERIMLMSKLTKAILKNIDYELIKKVRNRNFLYLQRKLYKANKLQINTDETICPLVYPFYTNDNSLRKLLINNKIYVATYWPNVLKSCGIDDFEFDFANNMLPLPIDQRYGIEDMNRIVSVINNN